MDYKRREFLRMTAALAIAPVACKLPGDKSKEPDIKDSTSTTSDTTAAAALASFGLQLWTLRDDLPKDPKGILKQVASYGYKEIESYEGPKGMFWGMTNKEFKSYMDELGMKIVASHCAIEKEFERKAAEAAEIGIKYLICPWKGPQKDIDAFKKFADEFNQKGEIAKKNGIRFAYHNHDYSFVDMNGQMGQDVMMKNTDAGLVDYELDMYWVVTAGQDIEAWLKKYPNRFRLCHVKDRTKNTNEKEASCILGQGSIDYPKVLKTAKENGMEYFIVEQEKYEGTTPLKAVEADANYMKGLRI